MTSLKTILITTASFFCVLSDSLQATPLAPPDASVVQARQELEKIGFAFCVSRALHVAADLKVADYLKDGPLSVDVLSDKLHVYKPAFERLIRILAKHGIFRLDTKGLVSLTPLSDLLRSDHPYSYQPVFAKEMLLERWTMLGPLQKALHNKSSFQEIYGKNFYKYMESHPETRKINDAGMMAYSKVEDQTVAYSYDFSRHQTVMDIGGGTGQLLCFILGAYPSVQGKLLELPMALKYGTFLEKEPTLKGRYEIIAQDALQDHLGAGDCYVLKRVLHTMQDHQCVRLLQRIRQALEAHRTTCPKRLLIVERLESNNDGTWKKVADQDVLFLALGPSVRDRTQQEFERLLHQAGLKLERVIETPTQVSILEVSLS